MESALLDNVLGSSLVPTIMSALVGKMYGSDKLDLMYITVTVGTVISAVTTSLHSEVRQFKNTRRYLAILTTSLLILSSMTSILMFHMVRINFSNYKLPNTISPHRPTNFSEILQHHLLADIVPGLILFSQALLCLLLRFELINRAKRKFSSSESAILAQLASMVYAVWALTIYSKIFRAGPFQVDQTTNILLHIGVIQFFAVLLPAHILLRSRNTFARYCLLAFGFILSFFITRALVRTARISDPITWLVDHIFATHQRISLFSLWLSALAACISFSTSWSRMVGQTNSLARKIFHLAACLVFVTGYNQDIDFTRFASGGMIIVMLLLEMIRAWNLWPLGSHLETVCFSLRGKWDNRYLTLSHVYLLLGITIPLWILPSAIEPSKLSLSSGLLAVGIGDAAAAIVGTFFGKTHLGLRSSKTLEGLIGNILSMAAFKLAWVGYSGFLDEFSFAFAATLTAFVEVISSNCDNLILPLVMILTLEVF